MVSGLLSIGQTWADRQTGERWSVYMVRRTEHQVVLEHRTDGRIDARRHLSYHELVAGHSLVLLPDTKETT
jgi:hypothetical protein